MKYYKLDELLKVTNSFAKRKTASRKLNRTLRRSESKKQKIAQKNVTEVSEETFIEVMSGLCVCSEKLIEKIGEKFTKLGYKVIEK